MRRKRERAKVEGAKFGRLKVASPRARGDHGEPRRGPVSPRQTVCVTREVMGKQNEDARRRPGESSVMRGCLCGVGTHYGKDSSASPRRTVLDLDLRTIA